MQLGGVLHDQCYKRVYLDRGLVTEVLSAHFANFISGRNHSHRSPICIPYTGLKGIFTARG